MSLTADFSASSLSGSNPLSVMFSDLSIGSPTSWDWDFGDGSPHSSLQNPTHIYTVSGTYIVSLSVSDGVLFSTETKPDYITVYIPLSFNTGGGFTRLKGPTLIFD
jgi:PKD repeat protein